ncbi:MAG TPA: hypothetical protein VFS90_09645 [Pyrinomonadaceae bacterium]|nr:hypothetical protein [Pyrinomonadaceae bacterium]
MFNFVAKALLAEVEEIVQRDFGLYFADRDSSSEFARRATFDGGVVSCDSGQYLLVRVVRSRLEDAEEISDKTVAPLTPSPWSNSMPASSSQT